MITRLVIDRKEPFAGGYEFPITGSYEKLSGRVYGEVDPKSPLNKVIVNLDGAPRNQKGNIDYWSDVYLLKPVDLKRGNGKIFYDAPNRGSKRILMFLNDAPANNDPDSPADAGNGFLMRRGHTIVWSGWQGDLVPGKNWLVMGVPIATRNGKEIVSRVRTEIVVTRDGVRSQPLSGDERVMSYEAATLDKSQASLTVREKSYGERSPVGQADWQYASLEKDPTTGKAEVKTSAKHLYLRSGFKPGHIYEFIYPAKNPLVLGLGFAGVRDLISYLRYEAEDGEGNANPLAPAAAVRAAYAWGRSQSGRFLRDFVYHGFNEDEAHRKVFDAVSPHVSGGGRLFLNYEFAQPVNSSQQHTNQLDPELFPFAYNVLKDPQTGKRDGILKRPKTDPYIVHTQTSTEYWQKRGCLAHTDGNGKDLSIPKKVRIYFIASAQHNAPFGAAEKSTATQQLTNTMPVGDALRALMVAMDRWACEGVPPPPSQIPMVGDKTLVPPDQKSTGFPDIPGVRYIGLHNRQLFLDYGPEIHTGRIDHHPPKPIKNRAYTILVPKVDGDGNDIAGIQLPAIRVPLGTHTGWNLQRQGLAEDELAGLLGSFIPFVKTEAERKRLRDSRPSLEERYKNFEDYFSRVCREVRAMIEERLLLAEDGERIIAEAKQRRELFDAGKTRKE